MKTLKSAAATLFLLLALAIPAIVPATAGAEGETADAEIAITPRSGNTFFTKAFKAANWKVETAISPSGPLVPTITPMKVADLGFPASNVLNFNPKASMPVCTDDQLGPPPTSNSIPVPNMIARCPNALIGNGTAVFALAQSTSPVATRDGEILIFNGGRVDGGLPKIKVYAYSYDTQVGIYTSAILQPDGQLRFEIPQLTSDSSVRTLNLAIPSKKIVREKPQFGLTVTLPPGKDPTYVRARCAGSGGFPWTADFTMGSRDNGGNPIGPPEFVISDTGTAPCTGVLARARIGNVRVFGPNRVKRNRPRVYRVRIRNAGFAPARGVRLRVFGRRISANVFVGRINPRANRTVRVRIRPRAVGRIRTVFRATSRNAGKKAAVKFIRVIR